MEKKNKKRSVINEQFEVLNACTLKYPKNIVKKKNHRLRKSYANPEQSQAQ